MSKDAEKYPIKKIAASRIGHQYGDSVKFRAFIDCTLTPIAELQDLLFKLLNIDLDTAKGIKLDLIGRIVGAPAVIPRALPQPFFGYAEQEQGQEFGELGFPEEGGFWRELGQPSNSDRVLDSVMYKTVTTAQIVKNNSLCNPDDIIAIAKMLLGEDIDFKYIDYKMGVILAPLQLLQRSEIQLLKNMLPIPLGVQFAVINNQYESLTLTDQQIQRIFNDERTV